MDKPKHIKGFFVAYTATNYRRLWLAVKTSYGGLFGKRNYHSSNPTLVLDHGLMWRVLRDIVVTFATAIRALVGLFVVVSIALLTPPIALLQIPMIPLIGLIRALYFRNKVRRAERAFRRAGN